MKIEIDMDKPTACYQCPFYHANAYREGNCLIGEVNGYVYRIDNPDWETPKFCPFKEDDE